MSVILTMGFSGVAVGAGLLATDYALEGFGLHPAVACCMCWAAGLGTLALRDLGVRS